MPITVGFIGFGEVGSALLSAMRAGGADVAAFDVLESKVSEAGAVFRPVAELVGRSEYILSTVTTPAARGAAESCLPYLKRGQVYVDLNSTSPSVKLELDRVIRPTGAHFVEGAILGAVGVTGAATRILIGGLAGQGVVETLKALGLKVSFFSEEIGKASTFKMLRSIFSKGLEALILEMLIAGRRAGMESDLWADVAEFMSRNPFDRVAENWLQTHAVACDRRYHEMVQVVETMREIGVVPVMTIATESFFDRSRALGLQHAFPAKPDSKEEVVAFMEHRLCDAEPQAAAELP
jgi:3-hydroxyisobutyrate dehydrogenase-like beta-hydroxyacid dehydrogenase